MDMIMDREISKDLKYWTEKLKLNTDEVKLIKRHTKKMKMSEFRDLIDIVTIRPNGEKMDLWFNIDKFTPVTLSIYYLNIRSLKYLLEEVWESKNSNRSRTTKIIASLPEQTVKYSSKYNFVHSEKQGVKCPNTKYWEDKNKNVRKLV